MGAILNASKHVTILCRLLAILLPLVCQQHRPLIDASISARAYMHKYVQLSFLALHGRSFEMAGDDCSEKQFNGNTHKHEAMVKKSTEGVSKDTPGTHPRSSTQARFNWKKATTLLVSASRFMEGVKKADERLSGTWKEMLVPSIDELKI
ncbi:tyrosine protein kinase csk [Echinococcus multilocularis]|uniref:Tyrosine protein kinase csk n=1 Tax=Echinococcus multilocularis TaxID=6211 RepID=A0A0S4MLM9_ECHMU|nr:tyrosine protein kinase csk [Echinococcus multilocularis]